MPRNKSNTVDYFPHIAKSGKTLSILEGKHGNDGYTFWFKLLEILSTSDGHFYDCSNEVDWQYLISRARLSDVSATEIINLLIVLGNIDKNLWVNHKIIWCQALVDNFEDVYRKRKRPLPNKPIFDNCDSYSITGPDIPITGPGSTQSKVEESKEKKRKEIPPKPPKGGDGDFDIFWKVYPRKIAKADALKKWQRLKQMGRLPPIDQILSAVEEQKTWDKWQEDGGKYIPHPGTWINQGRWEDEKPEEVKPQWMKELLAK